MAGSGKASGCNSPGATRSSERLAGGLRHRFRNLKVVAPRRIGEIFATRFSLGDRQRSYGQEIHRILLSPVRLAGPGLRRSKTEHSVRFNF